MDEQSGESEEEEVMLHALLSFSAFPSVFVCPSFCLSFPLPDATHPRPICVTHPHLAVHTNTHHCIPTHLQHSRSTTHYTTRCLQLVYLPCSSHYHGHVI